jgi:hypothetical protein
MLHKQFLSDDEKTYLLNIAENLTYAVANGHNAGLRYFSDIKDSQDKILRDISRKAASLILNRNLDFIYNSNNSLFVKIDTLGYISPHKDWVEKGLKVVNLNILLKKPKEGGIILHDNKQVLMKENDMYELDASLLHGVSTVKEGKYYSLVIWLYK